MELTASEAWSRILENAREKLPEPTYRIWLAETEPLALSQDLLAVGAGSEFAAEWIEDKYGRMLADVAAEVLGRRLTISFQHHTEVEERSASSMPRPAPASGERAGPVQPALTVGAPLNERYTFDRFVVGGNNQLAAAAARAVADSPARMYNPLFIYGGVGLGKTHLMHAIGHSLMEREPTKRVAYVSSEWFTNDLIASIQDGRMSEFRRRYREIDLLLIDDVHFLGEKERTQEEFFHTFNALVDQNRQVVISADKSPSDLEGVEERMRSRLGWGLVADIHPTTYELRLGILQAKAEQLGAPIPAKVLEFLAHKITSNVRELEGALNRIAAHATLVGRPVSLETTQEVLHDLLRAHDRRVTIEEIQKRVSEHFNVRVTDMHSARRARAVARPRQVAMYLSKQLTSRSLPEIGRKFGGRDHTTVMHAVRKVEELKSTDPSFAEDLDLLKRMLEA